MLCAVVGYICGGGGAYPCMDGMYAGGGCAKLVCDGVGYPLFASDDAESIRGYSMGVAGGALGWMVCVWRRELCPYTCPGWMFGGGPCCGIGGGPCCGIGGGSIG